MENFSIEEFSGIKKEILALTQEIQNRVNKLSSGIERKLQPEIQNILSETNLAVSAVLEGKSVAGIRNKLENILLRIEQREGIDNKNPLYDEKTPLSKKEFAEMKRTLWKTTLEILVEPEDRISQPDGMSFEEGIKYLAINPKRISKSIVEKLGMSKEEQTKRKNIEFFKKFLPHLEPLRAAEYYPKKEIHRFYRIKEGPQRGKLLGTRYQGKRKYFYLTDLYGGPMRADKILKEKTDFFLIQNIEKVITDVTNEVRYSWNKFRSDKNIRDENLDKIRKLAEQLKHAKNKIKVEIRDVLSEVNFEDSLGRLNPGAFLAKVLNKVKGRLVNLRRLQISNIDSYIAKDRAVLLSKLEDQKQPFEDFYKKVQYAALGGNLPLSRFLDEKGEWNQEDLTLIIEEHKKICNSMNKIQFAPFLAMADQFKRLSGIFFGRAAGFKKGEVGKESVVRAYLDVFLTSKDENIYRQFERIHYRLSLQQDVLRIETITEELQKIKEFTEQFSVAPHIKTNTYSKNWKIYRELIAEMEKIMKETEEQKKDKKEIFGALKKLLSDKLKQIQTINNP